VTDDTTRTDEQEERERVVIRDNRKIDPTTGQVRRRPADGSDDAGGRAAGPAGDAGPAAAEPAVEPGEGPVVAAALLDERTADLQRLQAEYANYRRRAERDRLAAGDAAVGRTLGEFLPVLDDLERAAAHGDLESGPLKAIADKLQAVFDKLGLEPFGTVGDPFDPSLHEAVLHEEGGEVAVPTCTTVMRKGYRFHDRLLRPAMVGVTDPSTSAAASSGQASGAAEGDTATPADQATQGDEQAQGDKGQPPATAEDGSASQGAN
jgi:molecular chaperone GrpE